MIRTEMISAALAATLIHTISAQADQKTVSYNVAAGYCSAPIAVPANNKAVTLSGTDIQNDIEGIGQVALLRANKNTTPALAWAGNDIFEGAVKGVASAPGTHIMWLDQMSLVDVQTAASLHIQVCNYVLNPKGTAFGYLTFVY